MAFPDVQARAKISNWRSRDGHRQCQEMEPIRQIRSPADFSHSPGIRCPGPFATRKDVLTARDAKEWERMAANKALTREGVIAGAVADAVAKKKSLNLEEELQKVRIDDFEYVRVPKPKEVFH